MRQARREATVAVMVVRCGEDEEEGASDGTTAGSPRRTKFSHPSYGHGTPLALPCTWIKKWIQEKKPGYNTRRLASLPLLYCRQEGGCPSAQLR